jgi:hypothetical protein
LKGRFGLSAKQINETLNGYEEKYIRDKMTLIEASPSFQNGKVKHLARYLLSALRDDYQPAKSSPAPAEKPAIKKQQPADDVIKRTEFRRYQDKQLIGLFHTLTELARTSIIKQFEKFLTGMYHHVYLRQGLDNLLVQDQLCVYLWQIKHELTEQVVTYDAWLSRAGNEV